MTIKASNRGHHQGRARSTNNTDNSKDEFGRWDKGCWYPPEQQITQVQPQFNEQPFVTHGPQGPIFVPAFPNPFGVPPGMLLPANGEQPGNNPMMMPVMMIPGMPPGIGLPPNFDPSTMPMPMPGMMAKIPPPLPGMPPLPGLDGMPPPPQMEGGMPPIPFPLPPNALHPNALGHAANYVAGTFMEDQIPHQTEPVVQDRPETVQNGPQDLFPEALRTLSISPSQSELSCNSTSVYESPSSSDTDNSLLQAEPTESHPTLPNEHEVEHDQQKTHFSGAKERVSRSNYTRKPNFDQGYGNRNAMHGAGRRGYQGGGYRGSTTGRPRTGPNAYPARGPPRTEDGEWQTVERSGPKHRPPPSRSAYRASNPQ